MLTCLQHYGTSPFNENELVAFVQLLSSNRSRKYPQELHATTINDEHINQIGSTSMFVQLERAPKLQRKSTSLLSKGPKAISKCFILTANVLDSALTSPD